MQWFEVDKIGLGKLLARRGKQFIIHELLQNAWDEDVTEVHIELKRVGIKNAILTVRDNSPNGFADLRHTFTLFADSSKKHDAEKRGRFNLGEKLVLALCDLARITTTTGTVIFEAKGRRRTSRKTETGSEFVGQLKLTRDEFEACEQAVTWVIPPKGVKTYFNGEPLQEYGACGIVEQVALPTEISDDEGHLRERQRKANVEIFETWHGEEGTLYEMGIPVVTTGDRYHVNVTQKVPLNMDRDNVKPSYLSKIRFIVAERMARELEEEDANSPWVKDAVTHHGDKMSDGLLTDLADLRFGKKRVAFDPSDPEANSLAVSKGYNVVHGGSMSKPEWEAMRRVDAMRPAGQVTPSPKPFSETGDPLKLLPFEKYTPAMKWFVAYSTELAQQLMGVRLTVKIAADRGWRFQGCYAPGGNLTVNAASTGRDWFEGSLAEINEFLIHEFGHEYSDDHLSSKYHDALCRLGGKLSQLALQKPTTFHRTMVEMGESDYDYAENE